MSKKPIFLVHGSWHWGGCFQKVADVLAAQGYPVSTPDLASHGYSAVPWSDVGSMEAYTAPVRALLDMADEPVILVGHSMGGVSLTYLADAMPHKIAKLVYLTAFMTPVGKTANDYIFSYANDPVAVSLFAILNPVQDWAALALDMGKPDLIKDAFYGDCSAADVKVATANAVVVNTSVPNVYAPERLSDIERHYIACTQDHAIPPSIQQKMMDDVPGAIRHELPTSHSPFFSASTALADIIRSIAGS